MTKYSFSYTKEDEKIAYQELERLEKELDTPLNWKKIKRQNGDNIALLISMLKKEDKNA